jgi:FixJ family two-component response regulator
MFPDSQGRGEDMTQVAHVASVNTERIEAEPSVVYVVDDEAAIREALGSLLRSVGFRVEAFASPQEFLACPKRTVASCLVLDVRLRGESGLAFQEEAARLDLPIPIIFMTAHGDVTMSVKAMKAGATDFLTKPFRDQDMLDAVARALAHDAARLAEARSLSNLRERYDSLTSREREVMTLVVAGLMNKQIAAEIGLSEITVKIHRGQMMRKMVARTVPDLVRKAQILGIPLPGWATS